MVSQVLGRAGRQSLEQDLLIPAGTGKDICARIHVVNSQGDRANEGRRNDPRHSTNLLWERVESCVTLVASIVVACVGISGVLMGRRLN